MRDKSKILGQGCALFPHILIFLIFYLRDDIVNVSSLYEKEKACIFNHNLRGIGMGSYNQLWFLERLLGMVIKTTSSKSSSEKAFISKSRMRLELALTHPPTHSDPFGETLSSLDILSPS